MNWPIFDHPEVFHVGTMDPSLKGSTHNAMSYEGNGLSVSLVPEAWKSIAKLGGYPTWHLQYAEDASLGHWGAVAKFLDVHALKPAHWDEVMTWAQKEDLVVETKVLSVNWYDDEMEQEVCMKFDASDPEQRQAAEDECEDRENGASIGMELGWKTTDKLNERIGFKVDVSSVKDMALTAYVEDVLFEQKNIQGVWWDDDLDVGSYSAPRGVIMAKAVDLWAKTRVDVTPTLRFDSVAGFCRLLDEVKDELYSEMVENFDCGPFDGCCVVFAQALQNVIGGEVVVVTNEDERADHAGVLLDGKIYDFDGPLRPEDFMERFARNEHVQTRGWRRIEDGDLEDAIRDPSLQKKLESLLHDALGDALSAHKTLGQASRALSFVEEIDHGKKQKPVV